MSKVQPGPSKPFDKNKVQYETPPYLTCPNCSACLDSNTYITIYKLYDDISKEGVSGWICKNCDYEIKNKDFYE